MFRKLCKIIFFKYYDLAYNEDVENNEAYNDGGLPKLRKEKAIYYGIPVMASNKCIRRAIKKYGIVRGDDGMDVIKKAVIYRKNIERNNNNSEMVTMSIVASSEQD